MKSFDERAKELMQSNPEGVRSLARGGNKYERAMAAIIIETAEKSLMHDNGAIADKKISSSDR